MNTKVKPRVTPATVAAASKASKVSDSENLEMSIEEIDAATAEEWLTLIDRQRAVRKARVVAIARDIVDGNWTLTGEAFKFDLNGRFVDGQHRAHAIVLADKMAKEAGRSGVSVEAVVVRGVPPEAMTVMDTGAARTPADQLNIASFQHPLLLAAATKWILLFERDALYADRLLKTVTHTEIRRFVENNEPLQRIVDITVTRLRKHIDAMTPASVAASYYLCYLKEPDEADWFFEKLASGASLDAGSPLLALRSRLRELRLHKTTLSGEVYMSLAIRTWNSVREGRELSSVPVYRRGIPIKCPQPI